MTVDTDGLLAQLVEALDRDLELVGIVRYRLIVVASLAAADQTPWLPGASRVMALASAALRSADLERESATERAADQLDLDPGARIEAVARRAGGVWGDVLRDRGRALTEAVMGVQGLAHTVNGQMGRRASLAEEALAFLRGDGNATYGPTHRREAVLVEGAI
jgi:hypothetical protein